MNEPSNEFKRKCIDFQSIRKPICIFSAIKQVDALTIKRQENDPFYFYQKDTCLNHIEACHQTTILEEDGLTSMFVNRYHSEQLVSKIGYVQKQIQI